MPPKPKKSPKSKEEKAKEKAEKAKEKAEKKARKTSEKRERKASRLVSPASSKASKLSKKESKDDSPQVESSMGLDKSGKPDVSSPTDPVPSSPSPEQSKKDKPRFGKRESEDKTEISDVSSPKDPVPSTPSPEQSKKDKPRFGKRESDDKTEVSSFKPAISPKPTSPRGSLAENDKQSEPHGILKPDKENEPRGILKTDKPKEPHGILKTEKHNEPEAVFHKSNTNQEEELTSQPSKQDIEVLRNPSPDHAVSPTESRRTCSKDRVSAQEEWIKPRITPENGGQPKPRESLRSNKQPNEDASPYRPIRPKRSSIEGRPNRVALQKCQKLNKEDGMRRRPEVEKSDKESSAALYCLCKVPDNIQLCKSDDKNPILPCGEQPKPQTKDFDREPPKESSKDKYCICKIPDGIKLCHTMDKNVPCGEQVKPDPYTASEMQPTKEEQTFEKYCLCQVPDGTKLCQNTDKNLPCEEQIKPEQQTPGEMRSTKDEEALEKYCLCKVPDDIKLCQSIEKHVIVPCMQPERVETPVNKIDKYDSTKELSESKYCLCSVPKNIKLCQSVDKSWVSPCDKQRNQQSETVPKGKDTCTSNYCPYKPSNEVVNQQDRLPENVCCTCKKPVVYGTNQTQNLNSCEKPLKPADQRPAEKFENHPNENPIGNCHCLEPNAEPENKPNEISPKGQEPNDVYSIYPCDQSPKEKDAQPIKNEDNDFRCFCKKPMVDGKPFEEKKQKYTAERDPNEFYTIYPCGQPSLVTQERQQIENPNENVDFRCLCNVPPENKFNQNIDKHMVIFPCERQMNENLNFPNNYQPINPNYVPPGPINQNASPGYPPNFPMPYDQGHQNLPDHATNLPPAETNYPSNQNPQFSPPNQNPQFSTAEYPNYLHSSSPTNQFTGPASYQKHPPNQDPTAEYPRPNHPFQAPNNQMPMTQQNHPIPQDAAFAKYRNQSPQPHFDQNPQIQNNQNATPGNNQSSYYPPNSILNQSPPADERSYPPMNHPPNAFSTQSPPADERSYPPMSHPPNAFSYQSPPSDERSYPPMNHPPNAFSNQPPPADERSYPPMNHPPNAFSNQPPPADERFYPPMNHPPNAFSNQPPPADERSYPPMNHPPNAFSNQPPPADEQTYPPMNYPLKHSPMSSRNQSPVTLPEQDRNFPLTSSDGRQNYSIPHNPSPLANQDPNSNNPYFNMNEKSHIPSRNQSPVPLANQNYSPLNPLADNQIPPNHAAPTLLPAPPNEPYSPINYPPKHRKNPLMSTQNHSPVILPERDQSPITQTVLTRTAPTNHVYFPRTPNENAFTPQTTLPPSTDLSQLSLTSSDDTPVPYAKYPQPPFTRAATHPHGKFPMQQPGDDHSSSFQPVHLSPQVLEKSKLIDSSSTSVTDSAYPAQTESSTVSVPPSPKKIKKHMKYSKSKGKDNAKPERQDHAKLEKQDDDKLFLLSVLPMMKKLGPDKKMEAKLEMMQTLQKAISPDELQNRNSKIKGPAQKLPKNLVLNEKFCNLDQLRESYKQLSMKKPLS